MMTWLHSFKIFLLICQLVNTSDHSLIQSSLSRSQMEKVKVLKVFQSRTFLIWSRITHQVISRSSWRKSGSSNTTDGSCKTVMEVPKSIWTSFWKLRVTGKHYKSFTTHSWDKSWQVHQVMVWERSISTTLVTSIQVEPKSSMTQRSSKNCKKDS